jgi:hypothetical protein
MNLNYALKVRKDINRLLNVSFIYLIETSLVVVSTCHCTKKEWKIMNMCGLI